MALDQFHTNNDKHYQRNTFLFFLNHLHEVTSLSATNHMTAANLAMMIGPTLSWSKGKVKLVNMPSLMLNQNKVVELLIRDVGLLISRNKWW